MSANEHKRIHMVHTKCVCVCVCSSACLCGCIYNTSETLKLVKDTCPCSLHSKVTVLWETLGAVPCSFLPFTWVDGLEQGRSQRPLSALWTAVEPHVMATCHTFSMAWADTLWLLALVTNWGFSTPPGELFISRSPIWTFFFSHFGGCSKSPKKWEWVWKFPWDCIQLYWEGWRQICHLMYYRSKCSSFQLCLPRLTKERRSGCGTGLMLSFPMRVLLCPDKDDSLSWKIGAAPECFFKDR